MYTQSMSEPASSPKHSPHVLDLSGSFASEVTGNVNALRGTVGEVVATAGIVLRPEESPAGSLIASAEAKQAAPELEVVAPFQPYTRTYYGLAREVLTAKDDAKLQARERANERRFLGDASVLLRDDSGRSSPTLTWNRLAAELDSQR